MNDMFSDRRYLPTAHATLPGGVSYHPLLCRVSLTELHKHLLAAVEFRNEKLYDYWRWRNTSSAMPPKTYRVPDTTHWVAARGNRAGLHAFALNDAIATLAKRHGARELLAYWGAPIRLIQKDPEKASESPAGAQTHASAAPSASHQAGEGGRDAVPGVPAVGESLPAILSATGRPPLFDYPEVCMGWRGRGATAGVWVHPLVGVNFQVMHVAGNPLGEMLCLPGTHASEAVRALTRVVDTLAALPLDAEDEDTRRMARVLYQLSPATVVALVVLGHEVSRSPRIHRLGAYVPGDVVSGTTSIDAVSDLVLPLVPTRYTPWMGLGRRDWSEAALHRYDFASPACMRFVLNEIVPLAEAVSESCGVPVDQPELWLDPGKVGLQAVGHRTTAEMEIVRVAASSAELTTDVMAHACERGIAAISSMSVRNQVGASGNTAPLELPDSTPPGRLVFITEYGASGETTVSVDVDAEGFVSARQLREAWAEASFRATGRRVGRKRLTAVKCEVTWCHDPAMMAWLWTRASEFGGKPACVVGRDDGRVHWRAAEYLGFKLPEFRGVKWDV